jgi:putative oxidoreductase
MFNNLVTASLVPLVLRLGLAVVFIYHGLEKVTGPETRLGLAWASKMKDPPAAPVQAAVAWGELLGGVAVAVGFLTRLAAAGLAAIMVGAIVTVHGPHGFSLAAGGFEYNFVLLVVCAALILAGPGTFAVDRFVRLRRKPVLGRSA